MDEDYSISVRIVTPDGFVCAQSDSRPARELLTTLSWPVGKTIRDTHYVQWPATVPVDTPVDLVVIVYETESVQPMAPQEGHVLMSWIDQ